jgi:hypothetical protein
MEDSIPVHGRIITCMDTVSIPGKMGAGTKATMRWTRSMVMVSISGLTGAVMKETGLMVNNMVKEDIFCPTTQSKLASGRMGNAYSGSMSER